MCLNSNSGKVFLLICVNIFVIIIVLSAIETSESVRITHRPPQYYQHKPLQAMNRILNGRVVDISDYPFQVALVQTNHFLDRKRIVCGGTIIKPTVIFTAAHCTHIADTQIRPDMSVLVGANSMRDPQGRYHKIAKIIKHPAFTFRSFDHDFSVIRLQQPVHYSARVQSIPVSRMDHRDGTPATASGWGLTEFGSPSKMLRAANLIVDDWHRCQEYFPRVFHPRITRNMLCVRPSPETTYYGDSGGPLVIDGELVGLVSFGRTVSGNKKTTVFTRVKNFLSFVEDVVPDFSDDD